MTKLLSPKAVAEAIGCNQETARKYMRQMIHLEKPLRVTEATFDAWVNQRSYQASGDIKEAAKNPPTTAPDRIPRRGRRNSA